MGEMLLGFAGSNTVAWDRYNIQIHEVVTAQNSVPGIKEIQVGYSYLFLENPTDWHILKWRCGLGTPLLLTPLFEDVESSAEEISCKIWLNLCFKMIKN